MGRAHSLALMFTGAYLRVCVVELVSKRRIAGKRGPRLTGGASRDRPRRGMAAHIAHRTGFPCCTALEPLGSRSGASLARPGSGREDVGPVRARSRWCQRQPRRASCMRVFKRQLQLKRSVCRLGPETLRTPFARGPLHRGACLRLTPSGSLAL